MKKLSFLCFLLVLTLSACHQEDGASTEPERFYFLTKLGNDTLAVEEISKTTNFIKSRVVIRIPRTSVREYELSLDNEGNLASYNASMINPVADTLIQQESATWQVDSLYDKIARGGTERAGNVTSDHSVLPFIDMVHWPFEIMLERSYLKENVYKQPLFSGTRFFVFEISTLSSDSMTVKHPSRGTMGVTVDRQGRLLKLDAGQTTRKLVVVRSEALDFEEIQNKFIKSDKLGKSFGSLSGRGKFDETIQGIEFMIDYGTPAKRGRDIWGKLVPYGQRWRTGANRATHFTIDKDVIIGGLEVSAGEYTLLSIPDENDATLIVNTQTGQNGRSYNEELDLGRIQLEKRTLASVVEVFAVKIEETDGQMLLKLQWDLHEYVVPIVVSGD